MKRTILSLMLLAVGLLGAQAQGTEDLDAKYTKGLLPVGTTAPDFVIKKAKENQPALSLSDYRTHQEGSLHVRVATFSSTFGQLGVLTVARRYLR